MFINGDQVASSRIDRTIPFFTGTRRRTWVWTT